MSISILSGDITVYFTNDTGGDKQIKWTGSTANTATRTVNEVYSALMDLFDNVTGGVGDYMNEGIPMKAITPTQYQIGRLETNDPEPWFIDDTTITHLTGGTIETVGWSRVNGTDTGIVKVTYTLGTDFVAGDIGLTVSDGTSSGTLLDYNGTEAWIRPNDNTATNDFSTGGTLSVSGGTGSVTVAAAANTTGDSTWSNVFTVGTIQGDEQIYVAQDGSVITPYWPVGQFNRLFKIREDSTLIDSGYLWVYIRRVNRLYDHFLVDASAGGANVAPLSSQDDLNNQTVGAISATGPGGTIVISFAGPYTADVDDNATDETYSIDIDCGTNTVAYVYEYLKYITRYTSTTSLNGIEGQQYIGIDNYIEYTGGITGTVNIGDTVTGSVSGATGIVVSINTTASPTYVTLQNSEGTFQTSENLAIGGNSINTTSLVTPIAPSKQAPFGTFAGGRLFGAHGVLIRNMAGTDVNRYQVIDDQGDVYAEPTQRTFTITAIQPGTEIRIFTNPGLTEVAGKEDVGGAGAPNGDKGLVQSGPDSDGLYTVSYTYIYGDLATDFSGETVGGDLPIFVVAHNVDYQWLRLSSTLEDANGSLQLAQISDRQYI